MANVATPPDETSSEPAGGPDAGDLEGEPAIASRGSPGTPGATERFFRCENHLHLNLNLRIGSVYRESELRRRCSRDKLPKLEEFLSDSSMLKEVAEPETLRGNGRSRQGTAFKRAAPPEEDARRLRRRALSRKLCVGQLVWDCSVQPARAARITAICATEERPFLVRHLDAAHGSSGSCASFSVNDPVSVSGRPGVVTWDGRPMHQFAKVRFEDGKESDVLPVCSLQANKSLVEEEVFVSDFDLESLELSHLLRPGYGSLFARLGWVILSADWQLVEMNVCWSFGGNRLPWPVKLLQECPETRTWRVLFLGAEWREESLSVACLRPYVQGDFAVLAGILPIAQEEHAKCGEAAEEKARSASLASKDTVTEAA
ncbi:unnamed protein product [Symbiodinium sp. KB8]|nr:unnamed protein product [Symbiodinium sp. KB8]